jgi:hypothetical protein
MGWAYLPRIGIPSLMSADGTGYHKYQPFEQDANRRAFCFFNENVEGFYQTKAEYKYNLSHGIEKGWNFRSNPLDVYHTATKNIYYDYYSPSDMSLINSLSLHAKWYDYTSWLGGIPGVLVIGIENGLYYKRHRIK